MKQDKDQAPATHLIAVVAMDAERVIGHEGDLPWHLPEDLKWFKKTTMGSAIIMGRKTFASIGRALPGRRNVVLSRRGMDPVPEGVEMVSSLEELLALDLGDTAYLIGGEEVFRLLLPHCDEILLAFVYGVHEGDTWFPVFEEEFEKPELLQKYEKFEHRKYRRKKLPA